MKPVAWNSFFGVHATLHPCEEVGLEMNTAQICVHAEQNHNT